jgi:hypothetical protein
MTFTSTNAEDTCLKNHSLSRAPTAGSARSAGAASAAGLPSFERPSAERPSTERPSTERPSTDSPSTDRSSIDSEPEWRDVAFPRPAWARTYTGATRASEKSWRTAPPTPFDGILSFGEDPRLEAARVRSAATSASLPATFPEGGAQAWLVVLGSFCAMLSVFGVINTAAVFESWFGEHQLARYTPSEIGWVFSLYLFFVFFVGIQVGPVFDRYGPRWPVALGSVLMVGSMLLLGLCEGEFRLSLDDIVVSGS